MTVAIAVYADWDGLPEPTRLGLLRAERGAGREIFSFEFDPAALENPALNRVQLDPRIGFFEGRQYAAAAADTFGIFSDASPDRWGRMLMQRRLERDQRAGREPRSKKLLESGYLLGVHDTYRAGALRFKRDDDGEFLDAQQEIAAPPFAWLRALEAASLALESDEDNTAREGDEWLRMLIAPGGSLGGARPKASVVDPQGQLWIAKFPSIRDDHDVGAWELLLHTLARQCGIRVAEGIAKRYANPYHTFHVRRFDRTSDNGRLHFASAMTLTGHKDGDDATTGASYLEIANALLRHGAQTGADLQELWTRIVFNLLVSNTDDHLRNHGFLLVPRKGWRLSPAYDLNPVPGATGLKLNISEVDNELNLDLACSVAHYFRVSAKRAKEILDTSRRVVKQWPILAQQIGIPGKEQDRMAEAFRLAR